MANVFCVADFFINSAMKNNEKDMTNLKLNKLLYFAQAWFLSRTGKPLFTEDIEAWTYGPVIPQVYHEYKSFGDATITKEDFCSRDAYSDEEYELLFDIAREYQSMSAFSLVNLSHINGGPWEKTQKEKKSTISKEEIKEYFDNMPSNLMSLSDIIHNSKIPIVECEVKDNICIIPKDFDDDEDSND